MASVCRWRASREFSRPRSAQSAPQRAATEAVCGRRCERTIRPPGELRAFGEAAAAGFARAAAEAVLIDLATSTEFNDAPPPADPSGPLH